MALLTLAAARIAAPSGASHYRFSAAMVCGVERWNIKTLKDRPRLRRAALTTVAHLVSVPRPSSLPPSSRLAFERRIFTVTASVTLDRTEADLDHHLVLKVGRNTMTAETPSSVCTQGATAYRRRQMNAARKAAGICSRARVTGVAFFDFLHGQTGVAPNGIELHPVLGFTCLSGGPPTPPPPPPPPPSPPPPPPPPPPPGCAASYPDQCIPPPPPDLNCGDIPYRNLRVLWNVPDPDPHHFAGNRNGIGCQT